MKLIPLGAVVLASTFLGGCGDDGTGPGDTTPDWFPGGVGTYWHFETTGSVVQTSGDTLVITGVLNYDIVDDTTHSQGFAVLEMYTYQSTTFTPQSGGDSLTVTETDTLFVHLTESVLEVFGELSGSDPDIMLQLPLEIGDTWFLNPLEEDLLEVMSLSEQVTVPTGTYSDCALVQTTPVEGDGPYLNRFYAEGVGPVLFIYHGVEEFQVIDYSCELTDYSL